MKKEKTNAMRILEKEKIDYEMLSYSSEDGKIDGISVAGKIGRGVQVVYKTLITQGTSHGYYVFVIPVESELDLKKAAKTVGEKKVEMIPVKDILKVSGYIRGGCSPIGMKKSYPTFIEQKAQSLDKMIVSGGKIGYQIEITFENLIKAAKAQLANLIKT